jgi:hypothetical protein
MLPHEWAWLDYCRRVVRDDEHRIDCAARGGSALGDPDGRGRVVYAEARWPGYLGALYRPGGILWVNIVHEDLGQRGYRAEADRYAGATARWRSAGQRDAGEDALYLEAQRRAYLGGLSTWTVGNLVRDVVVSTLGESLHTIAYCNAARCQVLVRKDGQHGPVQDRLVGLCQAWLPIDIAVDALQPSLVVFTSAVLLAERDWSWPGVLVVGLTQRYRIQSRSPWQPGMRPWREALRSEWMDRRTGGE